MSQLSSAGRKNRSKSAKNSAKRTLYFIIIFAIICFAITTACIYNTLKLRKYGSTYNTSTKQNNSEILEIGKKFYTNGIETKEIIENEGKILETFEIGDPLYEYYISYEQISGLKNTDVQNKINADIKNKVEELKKILPQRPEFDRISISVDVIGNFSDVLSVSCYYCLVGSENSEIENQTLGLNYRLDNGNRIKFEDLFWKDAGIKTIVSNSIYEKYAWEYAFNSDDAYMDLDKIDYGKIENQTFKKMAKFNSNHDIDFYFSPSDIYGIIDNFEFEIDMSKYAKDIAIYTNFLANDLYLDSNLQKEFYAFTNFHITDCFEIENMRGNNFYYEIIAYPNSEETNPEVKKAVQDKIDEKLQYYYDIAIQNPDKAYLASVVYYYETDEDAAEKFYQCDGIITETDLNYFKENKDSIIAKARMQDAAELWCYDFSFTDEKVEFYEEFMLHKTDYLNGEETENIYTKEDREADFAEL